MKKLTVVVMFIISCTHTSTPNNSTTDKPKHFEFTGSWQATGQFKHFPIYYNSVFENLYGQGTNFSMTTKFCSDVNCAQLLFTHTVKGKILGLAKTVNINLLSPGYSESEEVNLQVLTSRIVTQELSEAIRLEGMLPCGFEKLESDQSYQLNVGNECMGFYVFNEAMPKSLKITEYGDKFDFIAPISYGPYVKQKPKPQASN